MVDSVRAEREPGDGPSCGGGCSCGSAGTDDAPARGALARGAGQLRADRRTILRAAGVVAAAGLATAACANSGTRPPEPDASGDAIIDLDKVPVGGVAAVTIDRRPAFIARPDDNTVRAFSGVCTHQSCTVVAAGDTLLCPCHGSHFELLTGAVTRGPAEQDLPPIDVHVADGAVLRGP